MKLGNRSTANAVILNLIRLSRLRNIRLLYFVFEMHLCVHSLVK